MQHAERESAGTAEIALRSQIRRRNRLRRYEFGDFKFVGVVDDDQMVDGPVFKQAQQILRRAEN